MPRKRVWVGEDGTEYRSKLEMQVANKLLADNVEYQYEAHTLKYKVTASKHECTQCESTKINKLGDYLTDFYLPNSKIYVETKGRFTSVDRRKMEAVIKQYPDLDIRMLFPTDNWISKKHKKRYSGWCEQKGIPYAIGSLVPNEWY